MHYPHLVGRREESLPHHIWHKRLCRLISPFSTVTLLIAKPLNTSEAKGDLVMIQTLLLFRCKLLSYHAN